MEAFYVLASEDYRQLALAADWLSLLEGIARPGWRLLDVACGSGKFPAALARHIDLRALPEVAYDLLDPSTFSIAEARAQLRPPFRAAGEYAVTLQNLPTSAGVYDVVWATHALYALPPAELAKGAERFVSALGPGGLGFVAQATARSHYITFYDAFRSGVRRRTPYTSAEQVADALRAAGAQVRTQVVSYTSGTDDRAVAEGFLQRCAFDDTVSLAEMEAAPVLGDYLAGCRDSFGGYSFAHEIMLIWL
jgi:SAM-dependent methyltransferase